MAITSDNGFYLYEGSPTKFDNTLVVILCPVKVEKDDVIRVDVEVWDDVDNTVFYGSHPLVFTEAEVEALAEVELVEVGNLFNVPNTSSFLKFN